MATPEGIRIGSTMDAVRSVFEQPDIGPGDLVIVRASDRAVYRVQLTRRRVTSLTLELRRLDCTI